MRNLTTALFLIFIFFTVSVNCKDFAKGSNQNPSSQSGTFYRRVSGKNSTLSYNRSFRAQTPMKVATVPLGYGDGYMRALSPKADVLIGGQRCRVLGNITMDILMVDITGVEGACVGDEVVVIGRQGVEEVTLADLADLAGTIDYEICTQLNARVPRIYK